MDVREELWRITAGFFIHQGTLTGRGMPKESRTALKCLHGNYLANSKLRAISYPTGSRGAGVMEFPMEIDMFQFTTSKGLSEAIPATSPDMLDRGAKPSWTSLGLALGLALMHSACASPGMKLDVRPGSQPSTTQMDGLNVTLYPLDPELLKGRAARAMESFGEKFTR